MATKPRPTYRGTHTVRTLGGGTITANLDLYITDWDKLLRVMGDKAMRAKTLRTRAMHGLIEVRASNVTRSVAPDARMAALPPLDLDDIPF